METCLIPAAAHSIDGVRIGHREIGPRRGHHRPIVLLAGALSLALAIVGCGRSVNFDVLRAPRVNVRQLASDREPTVSIGEWNAVGPGSHHAALEIAQYLREAITNAPGGTVRFAQSGGVVTLHGTVHEHGYTEQLEETHQTCQRMEGKKTVSYPCTYYKLTGAARVRVSMNVIDHEGKTLAAETVPLEVPGQASARDEVPKLDWAAMLLLMRQEAAKRLAKSVVPYTVVVTKPWFPCGDADSLCDTALQRLQHGDFDGARTVLEDALEKLRAAKERDQKSIAAVYWGMTLAAEFGGEFDRALEFVQLAADHDRDEDAYLSEKASIRAEAANAAALAEHGVE